MKTDKSSTRATHSRRQSPDSLMALFPGNSCARPRPSCVEKHVPVFFLMAILALPGPLIAIQAKPAATGERWQVKAAGDDPFKNGTRVTVTIGRENIKCERNGNSSADKIAIPIASITEVSDAVISGRISEKVFADDEPDYISGCGKAPWTNDPYAFAACVGGGISAEMAISPLVIVLSSIPFEDHFVHITWRDEGAQQKRITFKVSKRAYRAFLAELRNRVGEGAEGNSNAFSAEGAQAVQPGSEKPASLTAESISAREEDPKSRLSRQLFPINSLLSPETATLSRCRVLATDSAEFRANCNEASVRPRNGAAPTLLVTLIKPSRPEWPNWALAYNLPREGR